MGSWFDVINPFQDGHIGIAGMSMVGGVETFRDLRQVENLRKKIEESYTFEDIISKTEN